MFYALFTDANGVTHSNLYHSHKDFTTTRSAPDTEIYSLIAFIVRGKTYAERQADLLNTALRFQYESDNLGPDSGKYIGLSCA